MSKKFAVFDIDGTLIRWQMFHAIVHHLGKHGYIDAKTHTSIKAARMVWKNRETNESFGAYEQLLVQAYKASLTNIDPKKYREIVDEVFDEYKDQLFVYTRELLQSLKHRGYVLLAISGSQDEIIQKLARYHGFDDAIGATLVIKNEVYSGEIVTPVHDKEKALDQLVQKHGLSYDGSIGVGDTASDVAMLTVVQQPIAFNPESSLYKHAKQHGWKIVVERKNVVYELTAKGREYTVQG